MDLLDPLGQRSRRGAGNQPQRRPDRGHTDLYREHIDMPVLKSILCDYEELLINDGCTGIAVLNPGIPQEVQFDEHKLLIVYGNELKAYERSCEARRACDDQISSSPRPSTCILPATLRPEFEELQTRLGIDGGY